MPNDSTAPIRSDDVQERARQNEERFESAESNINKARRRAEMVGMALQAKTPATPAGTRPGAAYVQYEPVLPGPDSERRGNVVSALTINKNPLFDGELLTGEGEIEILRPGRVWAATDSRRFSTFEARLQPPRLAEYNEILVPHIAGQINIDVFGPSDTYSIDGVTTSRLLRFDKPQQFNGRVRIQSQSRATTPQGDYIHTLGGLAFFESDWSAQGEVRCSTSAPKDGQIEAIEASLRPSGASPGFVTIVDGTETTPPLNVSKGDRIELRFESVPGSIDTTMARIEMSY